MLGRCRGIETVENGLTPTVANFFYRVRVKDPGTPRRERYRRPTSSARTSEMGPTKREAVEDGRNGVLLQRVGIAPDEHSRECRLDRSAS